MDRNKANRHIRILTGMTQEELAKRADISIGCLYHYEYGRGVSKRTERIIEMELDQAVENHEDDVVRVCCNELKVCRR